MELLIIHKLDTEASKKHSGEIFLKLAPSFQLEKVKPFPLEVYRRMPIFGPLRDLDTGAHELIWPSISIVDQYFCITLVEIK